MEREILFRGKRKDNGEWIEGYFAKSGGAFIICNNGLTYGGFEVFEIIPETRCEFTFMTDKNGVRIFEGDVVRNKDMWGEQIGVIVFKNGRFLVDWRTYNRYSNKGISVRTDDISPADEVIGNIHDNPELVGGAKNGI